MVKNTQGGSRHKSQARKLVNSALSDNVRFPNEEGEYVAKVSKMLGNGMCSVNIIYDNELLTNIVCHIRGKFRSRNKKNNFVSVGSTILVGLRSWTSKISACDLLHVYQDNHVNSLNIPLILINSTNINSLSHLHDDQGFVFDKSNHSFNLNDNNNLNDNDNDNDNLNNLLNDIDFDQI